MARFKRLPAFVRFCTLSAAITVAGCGVHPLPEDVSGVTTFDIVERLRCEAQEGLRSFDDEASWLIADATVIGMGFVFDMSASAGAGIAADFDRPGTSRNFAVDASAGGTFARSNKRAFETAERLIEVDDHECAGKQRRRNLAHPITGSIGLHEVIRTYIQLEKQTNLAKKSDTVFSDSLSFTTDYQLNVNPTWEMNAVVGTIRLTKLSLTSSGQRRDFHTLRVVLTRNPVRSNFDGVAFDRVRLKALIKSEDIRDPRSQLALVQKDSDARTRTLLELERLRVLNDDDRVAARVLGQRMLDILKLP